MALYAKKEGESQPAEAIECLLFMLPEQYSLSGIYPEQDGVRLEAADQESADVLLRHLQASGWTVTASPIWPRYSFASPPSLSNRFIMRNRELPPGALRRGRPVDWFGWTSTRMLSDSVKPQETSVLRKIRKTLVRGQTGGTPPPSPLRSLPKTPIPTPYNAKFLPTRQGR